MINTEKQKTLVIGHRNPDTDSICSAICYASLKRKLTGKDYEPCRAGNVNPETQFVLDYFGAEEPQLVEDVRTQVRDIEIRKTKGVDRGISLKTAWSLMQENNVVTIPCVTEEGVLEGVITIGDITKSYMTAASFPRPIPSIPTSWTPWRAALWWETRRHILIRERS